MEEEILCINGKFEPHFIEFYRKYRVATPLEGKIYHPREVIKHINGKVGFLLEELKNPQVPIDTLPLGKTMREPTWNVERFAHLNGTPLTVEEVKEWEREYNLTKNLNF